MSRRCVEKHLANLEADGLIKRHARQREGGGKTSNEYILLLSDGDEQNLRMPPAKSAHTPCAKSAHVITLEDTNHGNEPTETNVSVRRGRRLPSKPLPDDWVPDMAKAQSLMAELDLTRDEMNYCYQQMKGHAHATDRRLANWDQGFANWLRKAVKDGDVGRNSRSRRNSVNGSAFDF
jgi:hypothetical protein